MAKIHKCGLYIRVSTDEQAQVEEGSLKNQQDRLQRFVLEKNRTAEEFQTGDEWIVFKKYQDEGRSAKDTNRPEYQKLVADIDAGQVNALVFTELSRISRS